MSLQCASLHTAAISSLPVRQGPSLRAALELFVVSPSVQDVGNRTCGVRKEKALPKILWGKGV